MTDLKEFVMKKTNNFTKVKGQIYYNVKDAESVINILLQHYTNVIRADFKAGSIGIKYIKEK